MALFKETQSRRCETKKGSQSLKSLKDGRRSVLFLDPELAWSHKEHRINIVDNLTILPDRPDYLFVLVAPDTILQDCSVRSPDFPLTVGGKVKRGKRTGGLPFADKITLINSLAAN